MKKIISLILVMMIAMTALFAEGIYPVDIIDDFGDPVEIGLTFFSEKYDRFGSKEYTVSLTCFSDGVFVKIYDAYSDLSGYDYSNFNAKIKIGNTVYTEYLYSNDTMNDQGLALIRNATLSDDIVNALINNETIKLSIKAEPYRKDILISFDFQDYKYLKQITNAYLNQQYL